MTNHIFKLIDSDPRISETDLQNWIPHPLTFVEEASSIHTGGGCMVDILKLQGGTTVAISSEIIVVGNSIDEVMDDQGDLPSIDLTEPLEKPKTIVLWEHQDGKRYHVCRPDDLPDFKDGWQDYADSMSELNDLIFAYDRCEVVRLTYNGSY